MEGFEKISLEDSSDKAVATEQENTMLSKKMKAPLNSKALLIAAVVIGVIILFSIFGIVLPATKVYRQAKITQAEAKLAYDGLKQENIQVASDELDKTKIELIKTQQDLAAMGYLRFVPIANLYYSDASHLLAAAGYGLHAGQILVDAIKPYADVLGFHGQGTFIGGSAQDRIRTAVTTMSKVTPKIDDIESQLVNAKTEIDQVNPNHFPPIFGGQKVQQQLTQVKTVTDEAVGFIQQAKPLVKVLPALLGEPKEQKYLVLFQNDKELRPTGGFITAYAIFRIDHGMINVDTSNDIYNLDATIANKPVAPRPIALYLPKVPVWNLRDTNLSPDFIASMNDFMKMYKTATGYTPVSGVIAIDTHALVAAMNILGDVTTGGTTYSTKIDPRCQCAQVIYQLEAYADQPVEYIKSNRKGVIGDLLYALMQKAFASSPKKYWGPLLQTMTGEVNQKHILFDLDNQDAQSGIEALNGSGRIQDFSGDYLHVNDANFGGAKSNLFITQSVSQEYKVQGDGSIQKIVTLSYRNPFAPSDCNLEHGGLCLNAIQRDWVRVYVPKGSKLVDAKGSEVKVTSYDELGKTVFEGFLTVRPMGSATYTLTYQLPFKVASGSDLPLLIQKQPGTDNQQYTILVSGRTVENFPLLSDKEFKLNVH